MAIAISVVTGIAFQLDIEQFETSKADDSSAGTFSCSGPLFKGSNAAYASGMHPMDIIVLYGQRSTTSNPGPTVSVGPNTPRISATSGAAAPDAVVGGSSTAPINLKALTYGNDGGGMAVQLTSASLIFVGMLDSGSSDLDPSSSTLSLELHGKDLTKVFLVNDNFIAWDDKSAQLQSAFSGLSVPGRSATSLLLEMFDVFIAKNPPAVNAALTQANTPPSQVGNFLPGPPTIAQANAENELQSSYGYPWRDFIDTSRIDPDYITLNGDQSYPKFMVQNGNLWANAMELKNEPISRLYVTEDGFLLYDDQVTAWTTQAIQRTVPPEDIVRFTASVDDQDLVTLISIYGLQTANRGATAYLLGGVSAKNIFNTGIVSPFGTISQISVKKYGIRQVSFNSIWDTTPEQVQQRAFVLTLKNNMLYRARAVFKGRPDYRVGTRITVGAQGFCPQVSNATWYVQSVQQEASYLSADWTTTCDLVYPVVLQQISGGSTVTSA